MVSIRYWGWGTPIIRQLMVRRLQHSWKFKLMVFKKNDKSEKFDRTISVAPSISSSSRSPTDTIVLIHSGKSIWSDQYFLYIKPAKPFFSVLYLHSRFYIGAGKSLWQLAIACPSSLGQVMIFSKKWLICFVGSGKNASMGCLFVGSIDRSIVWDELRKEGRYRIGSVKKWVTGRFVDFTSSGKRHENRADRCRDAVAYLKNEPKPDTAHSDRPG